MFSDQFGQYLSFGATDQQTVTALSHEISGLLVPGTVAAFQRSGTGGFVLALSATEARLPYVIDPRFPLYQQRLTAPKRAHEALAELLGAPELVQRNRDPRPSDFNPGLVDRIGAAWSEFNGTYAHTSNDKFDKYARRLNELPSIENVQQPAYILAPYLMSRSVTDDWWDISQELYQSTLQNWSDEGTCIRVVAGESSDVVANHGASVDDKRIAIWVSGLDELTTSSESLADYGNAIRQVSQSGKAIFALYGGFYAVLMRSLGLGGASHGIGYGESRNWVELPHSGMPPARYYVPSLHRFLQPDEATQLLISNPRLVQCECPECQVRAPNTLDYHALMRHSVYCRAIEIQTWSDLQLAECTTRLQQETEEWFSALNQSRLPISITRNISAKTAHLERWISALRFLS